MSEWQPIETAPKDGTKVDLWGKIWRSTYDDFVYRRFTDYKFYNGCWHGDNETNAFRDYCITHWAPLVDGPKP